MAATVSPISVVAAPPTAASYSAGQYAWAVAAAKSRSAISTQVLASSLKVSPAQASALMARLSSRGVVGTVNANGMAKVVAPAFRATGLTTAVPISSASGAQARASTTAKVTQMIETLTNENAPSEDEALDVSDVSEVTLSADDPVQPGVSDAGRSAE